MVRSCGWPIVVLAMVLLVGWCSLLWWLFWFVDVDLKIFGREITLMFVWCF